MIRITVSEHQKQIVKLEIQGHAGSDVYGHDLVCAIVSGIGTGLCNALNQLANEEDMIVEDGHILIQVKQPDDKTELILHTGLIQLQTAEEVNKDFMIIRILEV